MKVFQKSGLWTASYRYHGVDATSAAAATMMAKPPRPRLENS